MRNVSKLLKKAKFSMMELLRWCFPPDDDDFIKALGVAPEKYTVKNPDGTIGYDFMAALNDVSAEVWE